MSEGIALTDADREGWLTTLGQLLQAPGRGADVLRTQKAYRDRLRNACPRLRFVFLEIDRARRKHAWQGPGPDPFLSAAPWWKASSPRWVPVRARPGVLTPGRRAAFAHLPSRPVPGLPKEVA